MAALQGDSASSPDSVLQTLAEAGTGGKHLGNVEREAWRNLVLPIEPYWVEVTLQDRDEQHYQAKVPVYLPHE